jgi:hypothetical protein
MWLAAITVVAVSHIKSEIAPAHMVGGPDGLENLFCPSGYLLNSLAHYFRGLPYLLFYECLASFTLLLFLSIAF